MRTQRERIHDILDAIERIDIYASHGDKSQLEDELIRVWFLYHFQIIGEASANISDELKEKYSRIPWNRIVGMRNIIVHEYFGIDLDEIWNTASVYLPELKKRILEIIDAENY